MQKTSVNASFAGLKILVVEDEALIASELKIFLENQGCVVAGPIGTIDRALDLARNEVLDGALLDINLNGSMIYPVAEVLSERNVPFIFLTGYSSVPSDPRFAQRPRVEKPFDLAELRRAMSREFSLPSSS
jgi:DNA-binding response OmpR family regulator